MLEESIDNDLDDTNLVGPPLSPGSMSFSGDDDNEALIRGDDDDGDDGNAVAGQGRARSARSPGSLYVMPSHGAWIT